MEDDASQPLSVRTVFPGHPVLDGARVECAHRLCANDRHAVGQAEADPFSRRILSGRRGLTCIVSAIAWLRHLSNGRLVNRPELVY